MGVETKYIDCTKDSCKDDCRIHSIEKRIDEDSLRRKCSKQDYDSLATLEVNRTPLKLEKLAKEGERPKRRPEKRLVDRIKREKEMEWQVVNNEDKRRLRGSVNNQTQV